ncbi:MAG: hypothetical protein ABIN13_12830 [Mucilaginibacter sp.]
MKKLLFSAVFVLSAASLSNSVLALNNSATQTSIQDKHVTGSSDFADKHVTGSSDFADKHVTGSSDLMDKHVTGSSDLA